MNINLKELEKKFHSDGYRLGIDALELKPEGQSFNRHVQRLHLMVDEMLDTFSTFAEKHNLLPACKKGCSWCCFQPVFALSYELENMLQYLKINLSEEELKVVYARAASKQRKLKGLEAEDLLTSKFPCPLLENHSCLAYAVRPVACRIYLSSDEESCRKFSKEPAKKDAFPALLNFPLRMGRMVNEGFSAALKAGGIQVTEFRIEEFIVRNGQ